MKRPERAKLRGAWFKVEYVHPLILRGEHGAQVEADIELYTQTIRIREDAAPEALQRLLAHEITHNYIAWGGLEQALVAATDKEVGAALLEAVCDAAGDMLYEVSKDNPGLFGK